MKFGVNSLRLYSLSCSSQGFLKEANGELRRIPCHVSEKRSGVETKNLDRLSSSIIDT